MHRRAFSPASRVSPTYSASPEPLHAVKSSASSGSPGGVRNFALYVNFARDLQPGQDNVPRDIFAKASVGTQTFQTKLLEDVLTPNPVFNFETLVRWTGEHHITLEVLEFGHGGNREMSIGTCKIDLRSILGIDWEGEPTLYNKDKRVGKLNVAVTWMEQSPPPAAHFPPPPRISTPRVSDVLDPGHYEQLVDSLKRIDNDQLQRYAVNVSKVVTQLHGARRDDWEEWQGREQKLLEEIIALQQLAADRQYLCTEEIRLDQELQAERRHRIDAESRLTSENRNSYQIQADNASRSNMAFQTEAAECRALHRKVSEAKHAEQRAETAERHAEARYLRVKQELGREADTARKNAAENELRLRASEAQALSKAWKLSGELRDELTAWEEFRGNGGGISPRGVRTGVHPGAAQQALQDIRGVKSRVNDLLGKY
eukprot:TRINITY_DN45501_c0_g1_i1.p1 TRINITY_DN45501_c0_g1~~TRINITY_DN45501_c0_g1_i1.p1  ORF type:complete len:429 (+),score=53.83 TRINITY_DN45501_c0_g1_i1:141-1427(+)